MLTTIEMLLFPIFAVAMIALAIRGFGRMYRIVARGQGPDRMLWNQLPRRIWAGIAALFSQGHILRNRTFSSLFHYGIAFGFIFYVIVNGVDVLEGYLPSDYHYWSAEYNYWWGNLYRLLADLLTISVLVGMVYFLVRRFLAKDRVLTVRDNVLFDARARNGGIARDSLIVGIFIIVHIGSRYLGAATAVALTEPDTWQPFATGLASVFSGLSTETLTTMWHVFWWLALGSILLFLPYFPYTKHAHLFIGPLNFMTRPNRGALGAMNPLNFDDETNEKFGVVSLNDLSQTQILDAFACIMCNRCQEACPAYNTGKELSPAAIEINKRYHIKHNFAALADGDTEVLGIPMLDYALSESALWACTSCGACSAVCPVGNEPMMDILDIRRSKVLMDDSYPHELATAFQGMERRGNPWGATDSRMEWARPLHFAVPTVDENPDFEYLFWVGCAGAFDPDAQKVAQSVATILHEAGVSFAVLGDQETCTGDSARRAGNEYLFFEMASANIETMNAYKVNERKVVTSCPHCLTAIGTEYKALGGDFTVFHHTQMISDLIGRGKLTMDLDNQLQHVTFHDPCYLGRHNSIYDDPREALAQAGLTLLEMDRNKRDSFCCGAGGAQMWKEEEHGSEAVSVNRFDEAVRTGAETLAVGCPFCAVMMRDANSERGNVVQVKDVAQLVAERLEKREPAGLPLAGD